MKRIIFSLFLFFLISNPVFSQCGTCSLADCSIVGPITGTNAATDLTTEMSKPAVISANTFYVKSDPIDYQEGPFTFTNCYLVRVTSSSQTLGLKISSVITGSNPSYSGVLYTGSNSCSNPINPTRSNVAVGSSGFNPEWDGLSPGVYTYCLTVNLPNNTSRMNNILMGFYLSGATTPNSGCSDCATATCDIAGPYIDFATAAIGEKASDFPNDNHCSKMVDISSSPVKSPDSYISYYKVSTSPTSTSLGIIISNGTGKIIPTSPNCGASTRVATLYASGSNCSSGTLGSSTSNSTGFFNQEWTGLTANTSYIVKVVTTATTGCQIQNQCASYYTPGAVTPLPCGTVGIAWRPANTPSTSDLNNCRDKNFEIKANSVIIATQDIAPGFLIDNDFGKINLTKIELDQGNTGSYTNTLLVKDITFCSPKVDYNVRLTGTVLATGNGIIRIVDHATGQVLFSGPFVTGMVIPINSGMIKGTAVFSGPGVSNYRLNYPTTGSTVYEAAGYGFFNPKTAGNGTHKIKYEWDNGSGPCGFSEITVTVSNCATPICKVVDIDLYDDDQMTTPHTGLNFNCSSNKVYLGPKDVVTKYFTTTEDPDFTWPFPMIKTKLVPISGNLTNLKINYYNPGTGVLIETADAIGTNSHFFARKEGYTISLKKTDNTTGTYNFTSYDVITGAVIASGTLIVTSGNESAKSIVMKPTNFKGSFSCATCGSGSLIQGIDPYIDELGIGTFDPSKAGTGFHDLIYTWDNELTGSNRCTGTKTIRVNVTGGPTGTASIGDICQGTSPAPLTFSSLSIAPNDPKKFSIDWDAAANTAGLRDIVDTTIAASSFKLSKTIIAGTYNGMFSVKNSTGCSSTPVAITIKVMPNPIISPTTAEICVDASISLSGSGIPNATSPWTLANSKVSMSGTGSSRSFKGISAGDCDVVYKDDKGCTDTVTIKVNGNPTIVIPSTPPIPAAFILEGKDSVLTVTGGSGTGGAPAWKSSSSANATVVGLGAANQSAKVSGVLLGNADIIYTDDKGCDDTVQIAISIPGCKAITKITTDQTWCQGDDPNAIEFSTDETATNGILFIVYPFASRPTTAAAVYAGVSLLNSIKKETPDASGKVLLDLPKLGTIASGALPSVVAGDYYIYAILDPVPSNALCRPYAEIKVTIKDTTSPLIKIEPTTNLNEYEVTWKDVPNAFSYKVDTVTYVKGTVPTLPNWKSLPTNITANHTLQPPLIFPNIPYGRTLLVRITPLDNSNNPLTYINNGNTLTCNSIRENRIDNPSCTKLDLQPLNIPDTVCAGESLEVLKGKLNPTTLSFDFIWLDSTDQHDWAPISPNVDYVITSPTNDSTKLAIKTNFTMNNSLIKLVVKDLATGQCSDTTLPVKILVNEIPDASISISPDPAKLCVGDPKPIEVTFQGSKGVQPYRFDFKLDVALKDTISSSPDGKVIFPFNTNNPIEDSTFILDSITDKNGCTARFTGKKVKLEVISIPLLDFQADKTIGCYPLEVIFTDKSAVLNSDVVWDFGNGDLDSTSLGVVKYVFQKSGDYTINFKSTIDGCWDTVQKTHYIRVKDRPEAQFSPKKTNISLIDPEIQFINSSSSNSVYYKWIFGDGSPVSNLENPKHMYIGDGSTGLPEPGKYTVELYAYINQDCWDSTSTIITIDDEQIYYIPNTFTPNGDEKNNTFQPVFTSGYDAQNYHFFVYNRWGELIFESNNPTIGWDGTYGNKLLANDTYTWKLQFKEKMTEKEHFLTGHVNLFK